MVQINLLPWREQARQRKQVRLGIMMASCAALSVVLIILTHIYYRGVIFEQNKANNYLQTQIQESDTNLATLKEKKNHQVTLLEQLRYLMNLRTNSFQAIRLLNVLATATPTSIILEKAIRMGKMITIYGQAETDTQVTQFMKNIGKMPGFKQPVLTSINSEQGVNGDERHFQLKVEED
ncbi:MAG: PilN domain-containing protein [Pseudomonadota bacterium]